MPPIPWCSTRRPAAGGRRVRDARPHSWRTTLRGIVTERLGLKAIALLLAVLLWLVVSARRPTEGYVRVQISPLLDSSLVLLEGTIPLRALVAGRAADLVKLAADPPVLRRRVGRNAPDTLVLDLTPADVHLPSGLADHVRVLDVTPRTITLRFRSRAALHRPVVTGARTLDPRAHTDSTVATRP
jgi:hypothetical protein